MSKPVSRLRMFFARVLAASLVLLFVFGNLAVAARAVNGLGGGNVLHGDIAPGQSLDVGFGNACSSQISTTQPFSNLGLNDSAAVYDTTNPSAATLSLVPLVAPSHGNASGTCSGTPLYPDNEVAENIDVSTVNQLTALNGYRYASTNVGLSGIGYVGLAKGSTSICVGPSTVCNSYPAAIYETTAITRLAKAQGLRYQVDFLEVTHGEGDATDVPPTYEGYLVQWQSSFQGDIPAITGQTSSAVSHTSTIPLFLEQQNGSIGPPLFFAGSPQDQWHAEIDHPRTIWCSGPKYQYPYISSGLHLQNIGYVRAGEKLAEDVDRVSRGLSSTMLSPSCTSSSSCSISVTGSTITENLKVPVAPLQWYSGSAGPHQSPTLLSNVWAAGKGYEAYDLVSATITSATNACPTVITETGWSVPSGGADIGLMYFTSVGGFVLGNYPTTYISSTSFSVPCSTVPGGTYQSAIGTLPEIVVYLPITGVTISGSCTPSGNYFLCPVQIALGTSTWQHLGIAYGMVQDADHASGQFGFQYAGGLLEDSDPFVGRLGGAQSNFMVAHWYQINSVAGGTHGSSPLPIALVLVPLALIRRRADNDGERKAA